MKTSKLFQKFVLIISLFGMNFSWGQTPTPPGSFESLEMTGNNFVSIPNNPIFNVGTPGTSRSFTGWFNICNTQSNAMLYTKHFCNNMPGHFSYVNATTGRVEFRGQVGGGCSSANLISLTSGTPGLNDNQWHHFAIIVTTNPAGTSTDVTIYIDGLMDAQSLNNPGIINNATSTAPLLIGVYRASNNNYSNLPIGRYDEFQVYDYALTQGDINNIIGGNAIANNNAIFPFEGPPIGTVITNTGNTGANGTHFTITNPNTPGQAPFVSNPNFVVPSISPVVLDLCTGIQTIEAQYSDGTIADTNLVYDWQISTDGITFTPFGSGGNSANYPFFQPGTYWIVVNVNAGTSGCDQTDTLQAIIEDCCLAATDPTFTYTANGVVIGVPTVWGGVSGDKYYVDGTVFVQAMFDITNCDVVFAPGGGFVVLEGGFIRSSNSTFRPCVIDETWQGITFQAGTTTIDEASGYFNECVFKNAEVALNIQTVRPTLPVSSTNNLFKNCIVGMNVNCGSHNGNISGNTFEVDQMPLIDPATAAPFVNYAGIQIANTTLDMAISQNDFLNLDPVNKEMIGINVTNNAIVSIIQNTFSDCHHALFAADAFVNFENNDLSLSHELPFNLGLIQLTGLSSAYRISYNELISTLPYNGTTSNPFFIMEGIHVENTDNTEINSNHIEGFMFGIDLVNTFGCRIYENTIVNSRRSGIITTQSADLAITCNVIDLQYNGTMGIQYATTSPINNDEIASNCFFDMRMAIGLDDPNNGGFPPYNPLPDIKNNYLYNYAQTGIGIGNLNGSIGSGPNDPGRNSFFSNNGAIDVNNNAGTTVIASGNYNLSNPGPNMGAVTNNNFYNSTASCGHQEDPNNNQSLYIEEVCYNEAPFTKIVVMKDGKLKLKVEELNAYISDYGVEHTFKAVISMAEFQGELTESLKAQLLAAVSVENQDELALLIGLYEHDAAVVSLLNSANWEDDKSLYLKGLYELEFDGELSALTYDEMTYFIENTMSKYRNKFIALQCQSEQRFVRPYIVDTPKEQTILPSEGEGKGIYEENGFEIYPNPAGDELNLSYEVEDLEEGQLFRIYDASGQLVQEHSIQHNSSFTRIDISNLNSGVYYIEMIYSTYRPSIKEKFVKM